MMAVWALMCLIPGNDAQAQVAREIAALDPPVRILEDPTGELGIEDILRSQDRFSASVDSSVNFGFTSSAYWFATQLERPAIGDSLMLKVSYPLLDRIDLYVLSASGRSELFRAGDTLDFRERQINHRAFVFPVVFAPKEESLQIYMRVRTTSAMQVPLSIWQPEAFHAESYDEQLLLGLYYGLLLAIMVSNAMMALSVREPAYAYYALYILFYGGFQMCVNGLAFEYIWPSSTYLAEKGTVIFMALGATLATAFSAELLEIWQRRDHLRRLFILFGVCNLVTLPMCLLVPYAFSIQLQTLLVTLGTGLFFWAGIIQLRRGVEVARYFLLAWTMFLLGIFIYGLKTYALLPENVFTEYAIQVGSALETILLSFAIAHRFKILREDKLRLQRESTELLETRVAQRTLDLEKTLDELSAVNTRLERLSIIDSLSGVFNRAYFNVNFDRLWELARVEQKPLAILMIDIDHFKRVNDNHGHLIGDNIISIVSKLVSEIVSREEDFVARYGGEEFAVVLPDTGQAAAMMLAEQIRVAVNSFDSDVEALARVGRISVSIGVASRIPQADDADPRSELLLSLADDALYRAKNSGRNRVCQAIRNQDIPDLGSDLGLGVMGLG
ncbi:sensor domain-containing diguanylate cyclase [Granulosicoccus sp. 3-233]|uniref:sensor domain-containing diguanylate cyclase n=1 Tax=Granulosicoccus sp. 3-233 TaxID=3417969 RepID=UPI003D3252B3